MSGEPAEEHAERVLVPSRAGVGVHPVPTLLFRSFEQVDERCVVVDIHVDERDSRTFGSQPEWAEVRYQTPRLEVVDIAAVLTEQSYGFAIAFIDVGLVETVPLVFEPGFDARGVVDVRHRVSVTDSWRGFFTIV